MIKNTANTMKSQHQKRSEKEENGDDYSRKEFSFNSFNRSLKLPNSVKSDSEIKAVYKNGILKLNLPKSEETQTEIKNFIEFLRNCQFLGRRDNIVDLSSCFSIEFRLDLEEKQVISVEHF